MKATTIIRTHGRRMTPRRVDVLKAIAGYWKEHGYAPSLRDLGRAIGVNSTNGVKEHIDVLEQFGLVDWEPRRPRTLRLTKAGEEHLEGADATA